MIRTSLNGKVDSLTMWMMCGRWPQMLSGKKPLSVGALTHSYEIRSDKLEATNHFNRLDPSKDVIKSVIDHIL